MSHTFAVTVPGCSTARLLLRELRMSDFATYVAHVGELAPGAGEVDRRQAWRLFASAAGCWLLTGAGWWAIELRETKELAGIVGAFYREGFPDLEVGWALISRFRDRGIATEAAEAALAFAFEVRQVKRVVAHIDAGNLASQAVARKLGMRCEGEVDFYEERLWRYSIERA
jgi:RimJ/RimL family protein N-acetyltransferase